jgi:hypothetical protein
MVERFICRVLAAGAIVLALMAVGSSAAVAAPQVIVQDDEFSADATFIGPAEAVNPLFGTYRLWRLRSWVTKSSHRVTHQLYVDTNTFDRRGWNQAADEDAGQRRVVRIAASSAGCRRKSDIGCVYHETVGVALDDAFVRAHAGGFRVKLSARSGDDLIIDVSATQIAPVLEAIDAYLQRGGDNATTGATNDLKSAPHQNRRADR